MRDGGTRRKQEWLEGLLVFGSVLLLWAAALPARAEPDDDFICTSPTERREIHVVPGCRVEYTKNHTTSILWSSSDPRFCAAKAATLVTALVRANFSCKTETTATPDEIASAASGKD